MEKDPIYTLDEKDETIRLHGPTRLPNASGYLWNKQMLLNISCQGYANVHFMQPEPASYTAGPALEAKTFLQPEHQYYPGHPGRFFYFKDHAESRYFSAPYAPIKAALDKFEFVVKNDALMWLITQGQWQIKLTVSLVENQVIERWTVEVTNTGEQTQSLTMWPCFNIGNQSWMNQSADFDNALNGIVADKVTPYQKTADYLRQRHFKEKTFLLCDRVPNSWTASLADFLGEGDWRLPAGIEQDELNETKAIYTSPVAAMAFSDTFVSGETKSFQFLFGAAQTNADIEQVKPILQSPQIDNPSTERSTPWNPLFEIQTPDKPLNHFINHWLTRQVYYHGQTHRLTTDPQTRNYLQDGMGMCFLDPAVMRQAILTTLSQQASLGDIPDGVLLHPDAQLKYINQVPHTDHAVWLPICLKVYLDETDDYDILKEVLPFADNQQETTVWEHIERAMVCLQNNLDERGLSLINQGDWCDPMNMVGHRGKGVSSWLTMATSWSFQQWSIICQQCHHNHAADYWQQLALKLNSDINQHFWRDQWYARGITDLGRTFGTQTDTEGRIFLNPQSWAMLCGAIDSNKLGSVQQAVESHLMTPYGPEMLSPAYTHMHEDIGRLTQKFPGVAENGAVYCHAAAFYIYALTQYQQIDYTLSLLLRLIPDPESCVQRGQLPNYVPNYYRGATSHYPDEIGRSSRLFNTGTVAWLLRTIIEEIGGLKGCPSGLIIKPKLPALWPSFDLTRRFRDHNIKLSVQRGDDHKSTEISVNGERLKGNRLILDGLPEQLFIDVTLPKETP